MSYVMVARWRAREGKTDKVEAILRELAVAIRGEPGNVQFTVLRSHDDPEEFLLYEIYKSAEAFRDHQLTDHFKKLVLERAVPLLGTRERRAYSIVDDI